MPAIPVTSETPPLVAFLKSFKANRIYSLLPVEIVERGMEDFRALAVTRLVMRESTRRFQLGYWHLEPMAAAFNGAVLVLLCFYAFLNALGTWLKGGSEPQLGLALGYAVAVSLICFTLFFCERQLNRRARSEFVRIDLQN